MDIARPRPAPLLSRFAAGAVDLVFVVVVFAVAIAMGALVPEGDIDEASIFIPRVLIAAFFVGALAVYFIVAEAHYGRTPGKALFGLRVAMGDGRPVTAGAAIVRNLLRPVDYAYAIGALVLVVTRRRQRIGDLVAGTMVIED